VHISFFES